MPVMCLHQLCAMCQVLQAMPTRGPRVAHTTPHRAPKTTKVGAANSEARATHSPHSWDDCVSLAQACLKKKAHVHWANPGSSSRGTNIEPYMHSCQRVRPPGQSSMGHCISSLTCVRHIGTPVPGATPHLEGGTCHRASERSLAPQTSRRAAAPAPPRVPAGAPGQGAAQAPWSWCCAPGGACIHAVRAEKLGDPSPAGVRRCAMVRAQQG